MIEANSSILDSSELIGADDVETPADLERELVRLELQLADRLELGRFVRRELVAIVRRGEHRTEPLLERWLELYTAHLYWARRECGDDEPPLPQRASVQMPERAAEAALGLLCG